MNDLIQTDDLPALTLKEARAEDALIRTDGGKFAIRLYLFNARKGYKALGFPSFAAYCKDSVDMPEQTIYGWMHRIEATLKVNGWTPKTLRENYPRDNFKLELLPKRTSAEINRIPSPTIAGKVWEEYKSTRDLATGSEKANINELKRIVTRYLQPEAGAPTVILPAAPTLPQEKQKPSTPAIAPPAVISTEKSDEELNLFEVDVDEVKPAKDELGCVNLDAERVLFNHATQRFILWITLPDGRSCSVKATAAEIHEAQFDGEADDEGEEDTE